MGDEEARIVYDRTYTTIKRKKETNSMCEPPELLNLFHFLTPGCFEGFDDKDPESFYCVYAKVFETINKEEQENAPNAENGKKIKIKKGPVFGNSKSNWDEVVSFYNHWTTFISRKHYGWEEFCLIFFSFFLN